jgi:hypothetical protein
MTIKTAFMTATLERLVAFFETLMNYRCFLTFFGRTTFLPTLVYLTRFLFLANFITNEKGVIL